MQALEALVAPVGEETVWIVSPPAGAKEIAQAAVLSASESATATASMRSQRALVDQVAAEALAVSSRTASRMRSCVVRRIVRRSGRGVDVGGRATRP